MKSFPLAIPRRDFLKTTGAIGAASLLGGQFNTVAAADKRAVRGDWFLKNPRVYLLDFQMPDPADQGVPGMPQDMLKMLDTRRITEQIAATGTDTLLVHAKCNQGNAYYNSKVCHKQSCLGETDLMAEFSEHCRDLGMNVLFYVQLSRERRSFLHPERRAIKEDGNPFVLMEDDPLLPSSEKKPVVCLNGPHREYIKNIVGELSTNYDFDGFWLDCFGWWAQLKVCYCESCRASYRGDTGSELPSMAKLYKSADGLQYRKWRRELNTEILRDICDHIRSINPRLTITHNGSGTRNSYNWEFCDADDYVCHEYHMDRGLANLSLMCQQHLALKPNTPHEIEIWRFANRHGAKGSSRGYQIRPVAAFMAEMAGIKAHGGFPQYYDQIKWDGTLDQKSLDRLKPAFDLVKKRDPWTGRGVPVPYVGILWSEKFLKKVQIRLR